MTNPQAYIESGNLELYCFGPFDAELAEEVRQMCLLHPQIRQELEAI